MDYLSHKKLEITNKPNRICLPSSKSCLEDNYTVFDKQNRSTEVNKLNLNGINVISPGQIAENCNTFSNTRQKIINLLQCG